jgi:hypothetical protein
MAETKNFLKNIDKDRLLSQIVVPGSHDAGVYERDSTATSIFVNKNTAVCQSGTIYEQCYHGSRFFDIRIDGSHRASHYKGAAGVKFGARGGKLITMLAEIKVFLKNNSSEFVILRFSKCKDYPWIISQVNEVLGTILFKGDANFADLKLGEVRGKVLAAYDNFKDDSFNLTEFLGFEKKKPLVIDGMAGVHSYKKLKNSKALEDKGLITCGSHAGTTHIKDVFRKQIKELHDHHTHGNGSAHHLHVMYWTQTSFLGRNIKKFTEGSGGAHQLMKEMKVSMALNFGHREIDELKRGRIKLGIAQAKLPNVIMYDFVNGITSMDIINLNFPSIRIF